MSERSTLDAPVTRREFVEELDKIASKIDELFRAKQVSWPLIVAIGGLTVTILGFGITNWARMVAVETATGAHSVTIEDFRERIRATEAHSVAMQTENETQHRWLADVIRLEMQHREQLAAMKYPDWPARNYWPLQGIGNANSINGKK